MTSVEELEARFYADHVDHHAVFAETVRKYVSPDAVILDAGAGRGERYPYHWGEVAASVVGVDVDQAIAENSNLSAAVIGDLARLPFKDSTFDLVFANYVLEHLEDPVRTFGELRRTMKTGAHLVFHTPNRFHYVALASMVTPHRFHEWFNERRGRVHHDTFPTTYRANDRRRLRRLASVSGFRVDRLALIEPKPEYLFFHPLAYRAGVGYERLVNSTPRLTDIRCVIVGDLEAVSEPPGARGWTG